MTYSDDELNALRYVSGCVPHVLLKKYEKKMEERVAPYLACLGSMAVAGDESSIHNYTSKWIEKVNRGGLFSVNDGLFCFFRLLSPQFASCFVPHITPAIHKKTLSKEI